MMRGHRGCIVAACIVSSQLRTLLLSRYQDVPYHNRTHAADVVSRLSSMLLVDDCIGSDESMISKCTVYAAILAAVIHDYDHPGTDNNFQVSRHTNQELFLFSDA